MSDESDRLLDTFMSGFGWHALGWEWWTLLTGQTLVVTFYFVRWWRAVRSETP